MADPAKNRCVNLKMFFTPRASWFTWLSGNMRTLPSLLLLLSGSITITNNWSYFVHVLKLRIKFVYEIFRSHIWIWSSHKNRHSSGSHRASRRVDRTKNTSKSWWGSQLHIINLSWHNILKTSRSFYNHALSYSEWINERGDERYWYPDESCLCSDIDINIQISRYWYWYPNQRYLCCQQL